ncbi:hypothetical protein LCGC14_0938180 [marine sediment metagenome]|uniref:Uncharacterized protein n=1 Tax=marine sediment metagenome TaxID=412755 RepID=A0A0F9P705_9ZZZZ
MADKIICDYCSEIRKVEIGFLSMDSYRRHLKTTGHKVNFNVYLAIHTRGK